MNRGLLLVLDLTSICFSTSLWAQTNCANVAPNLSNLIAAGANARTQYDSFNVTEVDGGAVQILNDGKSPAAYSRALSVFSDQTIRGRAPRDCVTEIIVTANNKNGKKLEGRCLVGVIQDPKKQIFFNLSECDTYTADKDFAAWLNSINKIPKA